MNAFLLVLKSFHDREAGKVGMPATGQAIGLREWGMGMADASLEAIPGHSTYLWGALSRPLVGGKEERKKNF